MMTAMSCTGQSFARPRGRCPAACAALTGGEAAERIVIARLLGTVILAKALILTFDGRAARNLMPPSARPLPPRFTDAADDRSGRSDAGRVEFLDLGFDPRTPQQVHAWLAARDADSAFAYVVTPNVDHMVRLAEASAEVRTAYADADLCLCDSRVLARLARFTGVELGVVPGSDLSADLFRDLLHPGDAVCLVGGSDGDGERLAALYPGIAVVQHRPPMGLRGDAVARRAAVDAAVAARARITLFAVGSPQQELLAYEMAQRAEARGTALCIGASVEFLLGTQTRAPQFVQRLSMEWAWRLLTDPRRLARRYLVEGPAIFPQVWRWRRARR
jgi:exopolysaccharide biosynthesis WecB/TagA/CpsF family protein